MPDLTLSSCLPQNMESHSEAGGDRDEKLLLLGSASKQRQEILRRLVGSSHKIIVCPVDVDETVYDDEVDNEKCVKQIAALKSDACIKALSAEMRQRIQSASEALLLCGDQLLAGKEGSRLGKPENKEMGRSMMKTFNGPDDKFLLIRSIQAMELTNLKSMHRIVGTDTVYIHLKEPLPTGEDFDEYFEKTDCRWAAGCVLLENDFIAKRVDRLVGEEESVLGLSPSLFNKLYDEHKAVLT